MEGVSMIWIPVAIATFGFVGLLGIIIWHIMEDL